MNEKFKQRLLQEIQHYIEYHHIQEGDWLDEVGFALEEAYNAGYEIGWNAANGAE